MSIPGTSVGLNFFQGAQTGTASSRQLVWSESSLQLGFPSSEKDPQPVLLTLLGWGLANLASFRYFLKLVLSCVPSCLRHFPARCFNLEKTVKQQVGFFFALTTYLSALEYEHKVLGVTARCWEPGLSKAFSKGLIKG